MGTLADRFTDRLPFVVGVTGHRHIDAGGEPRLAEEVDAVLADLKRRMAETPLIMICGMASGADLLCAERGLAAGIPICALLPAPLESYERDFSASDLDRLHAVIEHAIEVRVLDEDDKERGYVRLAESIARHSHLVIALWDGVASRGGGGTGDVVRMRVEGSQSEGSSGDISINAFPDVGPVVHIPTARAGEPAQSAHAAYIYPPRFDGDRGLPALRASSTANSSSASRTASAIRRSSRARSDGDTARHAGKAPWRERPPRRRPPPRRAGIVASTPPVAGSSTRSSSVAATMSGGLGVRIDDRDPIIGELDRRSPGR